MEGLGKYWNKDGSVYEGQFVGDVPHGNGKTAFPDGGTFVGEYI